MTIKAIAFDFKKIIQDTENTLFKQKQIDFPVSNKSNTIPHEPGIYLVSYKSESKRPIYIGETKDLHERIKDMHRTVNHTLRRSIGNKLFKNRKDIENKLDAFFQKKLCLQVLPVEFGRKEIEEYLVRKYSTKYNKPMKRGEK